MNTLKTVDHGNDIIPKTSWAFIKFYVYPNRFPFWTSILLVVTASLLHQSTPLLFKLIIDAVENNRYDLIAWYAAAYPVLFFLIQVAYRSASLFAAKVTISGRKIATTKLFNHVLHHGRTYYADHLAGALQGKINTITSSSENFINYVTWNYADALISFGAIMIVIALFSTEAALVFLLLMITLIGLNMFLTPKKEQLSVISAMASTAQSGEMVDVFSNSDAVRQFSRYKFESASLVKAATKLYKADYKSYLYGELIIGINVFIVVFAYATIMWILVGELTEKTLSTGNFVLILGLLAQIAYQLLFLGNSFQAGAQDFGQIKEGLSALVVPYDIINLPEATTLTISQGEIIWDNVSFDYSNVTVFKDFNLSIAPGQRVGIVGTSGAGKSTFVSLLLRQSDVNSGAIRIDGQDISQVTQDSLRLAIALVPQEPSLFHRSIKDNISYGKDGATLAEIHKAAKEAEAHDFIMCLSEGYDTLVGERGVKLSGGQKQRIAIARAMLKDAPILVLDEATSALDSESEVAIQKALEQLMEGKTVIAIAHRLSTLRKMDRIIVLEAGKIIEDGTHETLKSAGGKYQTLWTHQAGGFLLE